MKEEEENQEENNPFDDPRFTEPEVRRIGATELVRFIAFAFVLIVYFVIFLKIVVLK